MANFSMNRFESPEDNSSIVVKGETSSIFCDTIRVITPCIITPPCRGSARKHLVSELEVSYYSVPGRIKNLDRESALKSSLSRLLLTDEQTPIRVVGFDSEFGSKNNKISLIQLSHARRCLLIHSRSGLFASKTMKLFFRNELFPHLNLIFSGAQLDTSDCLEMLEIGLPMHGVLDLTPIYSQWISEKYAPNQRKDIPFLEFDKVVPVSLRTMLAETFESDWFKDKEITCSDWSDPHLSLPQLKYAVLDAWASFELGELAFKMLGDSIVQKFVFSSLELDSTFMVKEGNLLKMLIAQGEQLNKKQKEPLPINIGNMKVGSNGGARSFDVFCDTYGNHLRRGNEIQIVIKAPGGSPHGISLEAYVTKVDGRLAKIEILPISHARENTSGVDRRILSNISQSPASSIVSLWKKENDCCGPQTGMTSFSDSSKYKKLARVRLIAKDEGDRLLRFINFAIGRFIRSHIVGLKFYDSADELSILSKEVQAERNLHLTFDILTGRHFDNSAVDVMTEDELNAIEVHSHYLNESQHSAITRAFEHQVSIIQGPPGTGKTRTIAAIADVALAAKRRILILAPANSASRRILESLVHTGFEDACLIVSESYYFEWHQSTYEGSMSQYVHTKKDMVDSGHDDRTSGMSSRDVKHFKKRGAVRQIGKWTTVADMKKIDDNSIRPSVVIGTYGCIAGTIGDSNFEAKKKANKLQSWAKELDNLLDNSSIDLIIIDETSQLWSGGAINLFCNFPKLRNVVLVGDDAQLAPFGSDEIKNMKSLFSVALEHKCIPKTLLNITFRLPPIVASLVSTTIYDGQLQVGRSATADAAFLKTVQGFLYKPKSMLKPVLSHFVTSVSKSDPFANLLWLHTASPAHVHPETHSTGNRAEAYLVGGLCAELIVVHHTFMASARSDVSSLTFVILTPYLEHKDLIERELAKALAMAKYLNKNLVDLVDWVKSSLLVNTVDSFQGQEADIVFISCARSSVRGDNGPAQSGLGFFSNQKRANVMLTRASQMLIIVGDADNMAASFTSFGPRQSLLPSMAMWASENGSMFSLAVDTDRQVVLQSYVTSTKKKTIIQKKPKLLAAVTPVVAAKSSKLSATKKGKGQNDASFDNQVINFLKARNGWMRLSELGELIPKAKRPANYSTLIQPVRNIPNVELSLEDNSWILKLVSARLTKQQLALDLEVLLCYDGGSMTLDKILSKLNLKKMLLCDTINGSRLFSLYNGVLHLNRAIKWSHLLQLVLLSSNRTLLVPVDSVAAAAAKKHSGQLLMFSDGYTMKITSRDPVILI